MKRLSLYHQFTSLRSNQQGSVMPFVGMGILMLVSATGVAVDMGRAQIVQARMQNALDAAGLAAGSTINTADAQTVTNKYFWANFPASYMGSTVTSTGGNPVVTVTNDNNLLTLSATATVPTTFMKVLGVSSVPIAANTQVTRASKGMELVLVMDNTGSMQDLAGGSVTKLQASKDAAATLLDILYGSTNNTVDNLWVGLVPFSQTVNIGTGRSSWTTTTALNWGPDSWYGCVEARGATNRDVTDDPPSTELFKKYYYPCDADTDGNGPDTATNAWYGTNSSKNNCSTGSGLQYRTPFSTSTRGPNLYCPQPLTAMVAEKSTIISAVNSMQAVGGTEIPTGMAWGWRMLSPDWRGLWGGQMNTNSLPLDYNTPLMYKVVVLMTDGNNDISYNVYSAYGYPNSGGQLGTTPCSGSNCSVGESRLNDRTAQICASMKQHDIIIYTVGLGTSLNTTSQNLLRDCASKPEYFFLSPTTAALQTAFQQIGDSLANLRLSK